MRTVYERNLRAAEYSRRCRRVRRDKKRATDAAVQRALTAAAFLSALALAAYVITF